MVWLSVIVIGFLLLGRLAQTLLARCFEGGGPPCQLIEHLPGGLIEMLEFAQQLTIFDHRQVIGKQDVNGEPARLLISRNVASPRHPTILSPTIASVSDSRAALMCHGAFGSTAAIWKSTSKAGSSLIQ